MNAHFDRDGVIPRAARPATSFIQLNQVRVELECETRDHQAVTIRRTPLDYLEATYSKNSNNFKSEADKATAAKTF